MNWFTNKENLSPIEKYFDDLWFTEKSSIIQSAFSEELKEEYPNVPFSAKEIRAYAKNDDFNLWSKYGESFGEAEKYIDDTAISVSNSVKKAFNIAKYVPFLVVGFIAFSNYNKIAGAFSTYKKITKRK